MSARRALVHAGVASPDPQAAVRAARTPSVYPSLQQLGASHGCPGSGPWPPWGHLLVSSLSFSSRAPGTRVSRVWRHGQTGIAVSKGALAGLGVHPQGPLGRRAHMLWTWASSQKPRQSPLSWGGAGLGGCGGRCWARRVWRQGGDRSGRSREGRVRGLWAPALAPRGALRAAVGPAARVRRRPRGSLRPSLPHLPWSARKSGFVSGHRPEKCDPGKPGVRLEGAQLPQSFSTATPASGNVDTLPQPLEAREQNPSVSLERGSLPGRHPPGGPGLEAGGTPFLRPHPEPRT